MGFTLANIGGRAALVADGLYFDIETLSEQTMSSDPMDALAAPERLAQLNATLSKAAATGSVDDVTLACPVPTPRNVFGIGLNYHDHVAESGLDVPANPLVFTKFPTCLCGPTATVELRSDYVDYEAELVIVIGQGGKDIEEAAAWAHVAGITAGQDISDRVMQFAASPPHFDLAKSFDTFGPMGPYVISLDDVSDPENLHITCTVNGEQRQDSSTSGLIFGVPRLINYLSHITTLTTGDLIFTGTPAGVGASTRTFLANGDVIETTIEGVGTLTNRCVRISDHA